MTKLLKQAFEQIEKLSSDRQNAVAKWLLAELASEERWDQSYSASQSVLGKLAEEAVQEYRAGKTKILDADKL